MADSPSISAIVHTRDSAATLARTLATIGWADEIIVVDMESQDETCAVAVSAGARVLKVEPHARVDGVRTRFLSEATHDWIFVIDSDEYLADDARPAVAKLISTYGADVDAFAIPRFNYFGTRLLTGSGWYPDHQVRLFRKGTVEWGDTTHRPPEVLTGRLKVVQPPGGLHIHHTNYNDIAHVVCKQAEYARNDIYPTDPKRFSFETVVAQAYEEYRERLAREADGDYSFALATIMAWDKIIRGLIQWDRLGRKPALPNLYSLPVVVTKDQDGEIKWLNSELEALRAERGDLRAALDAANTERRDLRAECSALNADRNAARTQLDAILRSKSWKLTWPLRRVVGAVRSLVRGGG
jgi:glycosyltransferase involved in cell wall biosynthesis